jgi:hypothetical protein
LLNPDYHDILREFNAAGVEYLVVGAYALSAHGFPRATGDLDVLVHASTENAKRVYAALAAFGAPLDQLTVQDLSRPDTVFQIGIAPRRVDVLTGIDAVSFSEAWTNRVEVSISGLRIPVLGRAELIRNKRAVGRPQDLADVARLESSGS